MFDVTDAAPEQLTRTEEDEQFLKMQRQPRSGVFGAVYKKRQKEKKNIRKTKEAEREQIRLLGAESTATDKAISHK